MKVETPETSLESYLRTDYVTDTRQLDRIQSIVESVIPTFVEFTVPYRNFRTWPYLLRRDKSPKADDKLSNSTHLMILFALNAIILGGGRSGRDAAPRPVLFPAQLRTPKLDFKKLRGVVEHAMADIVTILKKRRARSPHKPFVWSRTFGDDDPMTLSWLTELLLRPPAGFRQDAKFRRVVRDVAKNVCRQRTREEVLSFRSKENKDPKRTENPHCFLWLRLLHLAKAAAQLSASNRRPAREPLKTLAIDPMDFEDELYRQLGYFTVTDSRFDPASLVFALEGVLQFDPQALSDNTIASWFRTLEESQNRNPYWRPVTPFLGDSQGMVLFPVSVEISNSLLRTYEILERAKRPTHRATLEALLRRYAQWLEARIERHPYVYRSKSSVKEVRQGIGWHSEHVNQPGLIHLWETSQVLLFLVHYWSLLQRKIAAEGLSHAGLRLREWDTIEPVDFFWKDEPLVKLSRVKSGATSDAEGGHADYAVLKKIHDSFIGKGKPRSLLLYGPPGTGKTTVAEQMAIGLEWPLLIITVSDFLAGGAAEVEARAKGVFQVLQEQQNTIILFDEIDQFLLDRNSAAYRQQQGSIFQFLTPGMLTKFQDLKDKKRSIFIVATNYADRIDGAITRQGRIDDRLLLSLPDRARRREFLWTFLCAKLAELKAAPDWKDYLAKASGDAKAIVDAAKREKDDILTDATIRRQFNAIASLDAVLKKTYWFGYGDLKRLVDNLLTIRPGDTWKTIGDNLLGSCQAVVPAVKLNAYLSRFEALKRNEEAPSEEFALLVYLVGECGARFSPTQEAVIEKVFEHKPFEEMLEQLPVSNSEVRNIVRQAFVKARATRRGPVEKKTRKFLPRRGTKRRRQK